MTSFNLILKKILDLESYIFSTYEKNNKVNSYQQLIFNSMLNFLRFNGNKIKYKFNFLNNCLNNMFYGDDTKKQILENFCKIQRTYYAFNRLAYLYKFNSSKIVVNKDMALNEINLNDKNIICIYQLNYKYLFNIKDILKVVESSLTNSTMFFLNPITIKNPYNNLPFSKSNLYNIYFTLFFKCIPIPEIIQKFFKFDFDLDLFEKKNQILLRECAILNYLNNIQDEEFISDTKTMLQRYNEAHYKKIEIDNDFPNEKLIHIFKPYLFMYYISTLSFDYYKKINCKEVLEKMLFRFRYYFPRFGRKRIKIKFLKKYSKTTYQKIVGFNEDYPPFYCNKNNKFFLSSHLGLMKTQDINELLSHEEFIIHCNELEKDRISIRYLIRNNPRVIEDTEDVVSVE